MDRIEIPDNQVSSIQAFAPRIHGLRILFVNVYGIVQPDGSWILLDAGLPFSETYLRSWAEKTFEKPPTALVLTHGHFDHVGVALDLANGWDIPVYAHRLEFPYLTGQQEYPRPNAAAGGGMMSLMSPMLPRSPIDLRPRLSELNVETMQDLLPGWQMIHTPGHTPGHVSFYRESDRLLLPADAFCTTKAEAFFQAAIAQNPELHGPPAYFTQDWPQARKSVELLAGLNPQIIAPGHGQPVSGGGVAEKLRRLAANFEEVAVPENRDSAA